MNEVMKWTGAAAIALMASSAGAATVINGSFEDIGSGNSLNRGGWNIFSSVPGWTGDPNVEIQSGRTLSGIDARTGSNYAELDTNQDAGIFQDIFFAVGTYRLSFFYSPRVNVSPTSTNDMLYSVGSLTSGSILGAPNRDYAWGEWTEEASTFSVATEGTYRLSLFADGGSFQSGCGNCGALIDDVSISAVPLPASALFLLAGVGGLGAMRARRRSA